MLIPPCIELFAPPPQPLHTDVEVAQGFLLMMLTKTRPLTLSLCHPREWGGKEEWPQPHNLWWIHSLFFLWRHVPTRYSMYVKGGRGGSQLQKSQLRSSLLDGRFTDRLNKIFESKKVPINFWMETFLFIDSDLQNFTSIIIMMMLKHYFQNYSNNNSRQGEGQNNIGNWITFNFYSYLWTQTP